MTKKILILLSLVVILGLVVILAQKPFHHRFDTGEGSPFYPDLKEEEIAALEIEYLVNGTRFEKDPEGKWLVMTKETELQKQIGAEEKKQAKQTEEKIEHKKITADGDKVQEIIDTLVELKKGPPVTDNPEKQGLLELTDAALNVAAFDMQGKELAKLYVGKQGPDIFSTFVRNKGDNTIYLVDKHLSGIFSRPIEEWLKKEEEKQETEK